MKKYLFNILIVICVLFLSGCCNNSKTTNNNSTNTNVKKTQSISPDKANKKLFDCAVTTGKKDAKVNIIEASDFECPACKYWHDEFKKIVDEYHDKILFGYITYPLSYHPNAVTIALAVKASEKQDKGWEMHDLLFENDQFELSKIDEAVKQLDLDTKQFEQDRNNNDLKEEINKAKELLDQLNLKGTPTFYINGKEFQDNPTYDNLKKEIEKLL